MSRVIPEVRQTDRPGQQRNVSWRRDAPLPARYLQLHAQLIADPKPMSGRCGGYVYSWHNGRLHWHRYVVPKDPRTPPQQRSRAAFATASRAWSKNQWLTAEQRDAWHEDAAKIKCRPRLGPSGFRTAQQHFVGSNSVKERYGLDLLPEPPKRKPYAARGREDKVELILQVEDTQWLARSPSSTHRGPAVSLQSPHRVTDRCAGKPTGHPVPSQVLLFQHLTRASSEPLHTSAGPTPLHCRWESRSSRRPGSIGLSQSASALAQVRRNAHYRELWRGG